MELYLNRYGILSGIVKGIKIIFWVAASGAVAALTAKLAEVTIQPDQIYAVAAVGAANVVLGGIGKYLVTNKPDFNFSLFGKKKVTPVEQVEGTDPLIAG